MDSNDLWLTGRLEQGIRRTSEEFQNYPVDFLYESDIQALLFSNLRDVFNDCRFKPIGLDTENLFGSVPDINPVKSEYRIMQDKKSIGRFDVAILSSEQDKSARIWSQAARAAIEVKLWQPDGTGGGPWDDIKKLKSYFVEKNTQKRRFTGIALLFIHPGPRAKRWTKEYLPSETIAPEFKNDGVSLQVVTPDRHWSIPEDSYA